MATSTHPRHPVVALGSPASEAAVVGAVPDSLLRRASAEPQRAIPAIAKEPESCALLERALRSLSTGHCLRLGDSRSMDVAEQSVHLVLTSPPYWTLKKYNAPQGQLGEVEDYEDFLDQLDEVWRLAHRALVPGGRMVVVVGDVNVARRSFGRHLVFPLHASIAERCRQIGFDNLAPIIWHKIGNAQYEMGAGGYYGKPFEPNGVIKNEIEYILFQRKPGGYRRPSLATRVMSVIPADMHAECFQQVWRMSGASTRHHPAPFPLSLADRLIRMFSFAGDTVLDPFLGSGTTSAAAGACGRNSIGWEIDPTYLEAAARRVSDMLGARDQQALDLSA